MQGSEKVIAALNKTLQEEFTALSQYFIHAEMCENWKYLNLAKHLKQVSIMEMKHAEKLIGRLLFLGGVPIVSNLNEMHIGADVPKMFTFDHSAEADAIKNYNSGIVICGDAKDFATREILEKILKDEDRHIDQIEELQDQISQMSLQLFLTTQVG